MVGYHSLAKENQFNPFLRIVSCELIAESDPFADIRCLHHVGKDVVQEYDGVLHKQPRHTVDERLGVSTTCSESWDSKEITGANDPIFQKKLTLSTFIIPSIKSLQLWLIRSCCITTFTIFHPFHRVPTLVAISMHSSMSSFTASYLWLPSMKIKSKSMCRNLCWEKALVFRLSKLTNERTTPNESKTKQTAYLGFKHAPGQHLCGIAF